MHPSPYVGPRAFREGEHLHGRGPEIAALLDLLIARRIVLLHSPSGAGKTSLIQAGLVPRLKEEGFLVRRTIRVSSRPPGELDGQNRYVWSAIASLEDGPQPEEEDGGDGAHRLVRFLDRRTGTVGQQAEEVLIFDQFEELLTLDTTDRAAKEQFMAEVGAALRDRRRWALFAMREDFLGALEPYLHFVPTGLSTTFRLDFLSEEAARRAMELPARALGVNFTEAASRKLIDDLRRVRVLRPSGVTEDLGPYVEPVQLQVVCSSLWGSLPEGTSEIGEADVVAVGSVDEALAGYYHQSVEAVARHTGVPERTIRDWVDTDLITPQGLRGQTLHGPEGPSDASTQVVARLADAHLIRGEKRRGAIWYELAHDRLIGPVRADNRSWRERNLSVLERHAALWASEDQKPGLLLADEALAEAERWASEQPPGRLTEVDRTFLEASITKRDELHRERRRARRDRRLMLGAVFLAAVTVLASLSVVRANRERNLAQAGELMAFAQENVRADPMLALALAIRAAEKVGSSGTISAGAALTTLYRLVPEIPPRLISSYPDQAAAGVDVSPDGKRVALIPVSGGGDQQLSRRGLVNLWPVEGGGDQTSLSLRGEPLVQAAFDRTGNGVAGLTGDVAAVWRIASPKEPPLELDRPVGAGSMTALAFDGDTLAAGDDDGYVHVWSLGESDGALADARTLEGHEGAITAVAISTDRGLLATGGDDRTPKVWDVAAGQERLTLSGHADYVNAVAFSPDGRLVATGSDDDTAKLWDVTTGELRQTLSGHANQVNAVAFSPDGALLATGSHDQTAKVWDVASGEELLTLSGPMGSVVGVDFATKGAALVTAHTSGAALLWDVADPRLASEAGAATPRGHQDYVNAVAFSPDGRLVATGSDDDTAKLWDTATGQELRTLVGHEDWVNSVAFSPDGRLVATGSDDETAKLWDAATGRDLRTLSGHADYVNAVAFSPDGRLVATGSDDNTAKLWDAATGRDLRTLSGHADYVNAVAFSPDGSLLATGSEDGEARLWDTATGQEVRTLDGHEDGVNSVAFSPDGRLVGTGSDDNTAKLWDTATGQHLRTLSGHADYVDAVAFSPDGALLATGSEDDTAVLWDTGTGDEVRTLVGHEDWVSSVAFSPDGRVVATGSDDNTARLWDRDSGESRHVLGPLSVDTAMRAVAFSPDGQLIVTANQSGTATLWDASSCRPPVDSCRPLRSLEGHTATVFDVAFDAAGTRLATASEDGSAKIWDVATGDMVATFESQADEVYDIAFSPDGRLLAAAGSDPTVEVWEISSGQRMTLDGGDEAVADVVFSPRGRFLAAAGTDGVARIFDTETIRPDADPAPVRVIQHDDAVVGVAFSPIGNRVVTASLDGTGKLLDLSSGRQATTLGEENGAALYDVAFGENGEWIVTAGDAGAVMWDPRSGMQWLTLPSDDEDQVTTGVAFSADGRHLAVVGTTGLVVHDMDVKSVVEAAKSRTTRDLSSAECRRFLHRQTC